MGKEESVREMATTRVPTLQDKVQALFDAGAEFPYGQSIDPPAPPKGRSVRQNQIQPVLKRQVIQHLHDGGAWIAMKLEDGTTCRTINAAKLRCLAEDPSLLKKGLDKEIHLERVGLATA